MYRNLENIVLRKIDLKFRVSGSHPPTAATGRPNCECHNIQSWVIIFWEYTFKTWPNRFVKKKEIDFLKMLILKMPQWNFYGLSKATRRKNYFCKLSLFIYFFIDLYYKLYYYTLSLHIAEHNILPLLKLILRWQISNLNCYLTYMYNAV